MTMNANENVISSFAEFVILAVVTGRAPFARCAEQRCLWQPFFKNRQPLYV